MKDNALLSSVDFSGLVSVAVGINFDGLEALGGGVISFPLLQHLGDSDDAVAGDIIGDFEAEEFLPNTSLLFPSLVEAGEIDLGSSNLVSFSAPNLVEMNRFVTDSSTSALTALAFPSLVTARGSIVLRAPLLASFSAPFLQQVVD